MTSRDRPAIEITPEMIERAVDVFWAHYPETAVGGDLDRQMCREIIAAALKAHVDTQPSTPRRP